MYASLSRIGVRVLCNMVIVNYYYLTFFNLPRPTAATAATATTATA